MSVAKQSGAASTMYRSVSPVNLRKKTNFSRIELVHCREPKLATFSSAVHCDVMSYNLLPESNGVQGADLAQYLFSDFTYNVDPQLDLKLVHERVL